MSENNDLNCLPGEIIAMPPMKTLRDEFAMAALPAMIVKFADIRMEFRAVSDLAYAQADAMMEARKK